MVSFVPMDPTDDDSIDLVLAFTDRILQYGEDMEPKEPALTRAEQLVEEQAYGMAEQGDLEGAWSGAAAGAGLGAGRP